nr:bifunctional 3-(3-hydroxy-phenyl)propionate/3-hydroxycinnamic acid hydroxylase [Nocardia vinacea]
MSNASGPPASMLPQVLIVGAGPTGLTAANLLGAYGVRVLLIERNPGTSDAAKAISIDDESLRTLQIAGLDGPLSEIIVPGTGTKYFGADGRPLVHARGPGDLRHGHPFKNPFAQPDLERLLRTALDRYPHVQTRFSTSLTGLSQDADGVRAILTPTEGSDEQVSVAYLFGCDGGRSTVRELLAVPMDGRSFPEDVWLVVDTLGDPHDERYGMHLGDPARPTVIVPGRDGRCRYEFRLRPGECAAGAPPGFDLVQRLLSPHREVDSDQVERAVVYTFHALLAERLCEGRCFLLGDAAHMMPPFAGQGLNSGLRDAVNLCWKIAHALDGRAGEALLGTYECERRPHARASIELSVRLGRIVMTTDVRRARLRDLLVRAAMRTKSGRRYLTEMRYRPSARVSSGAVIRFDGRAHLLVGTPLPQPRVLHGPHTKMTRLDDVLGPGWSLLGVGVTDADWHRADRAGLPEGIRVEVVLGDRVPRPGSGRTAVADYDGRLDALFGELAGSFVLVRPDRLVAAVFAPAEAERVGGRLGRFVVPGPVPASGVAADTPFTDYLPALDSKGIRP